MCNAWCRRLRCRFYEPEGRGECGETVVDLWGCDTAITLSRQHDQPLDVRSDPPCATVISVAAGIGVFAGKIEFVYLTGRNVSTRRSLASGGDICERGSCGAPGPRLKFRRLPGASVGAPLRRGRAATVPAGAMRRLAIPAVAPLGEYAGDRRRGLLDVGDSGLRAFVLALAPSFYSKAIARRSSKNSPRVYDDLLPSRGLRVAGTRSGRPEAAAQSCVRRGLPIVLAYPSAL
jgi:hypothetical protein